MEDIKDWKTKFEACQYSDRLINKLLLMNKAAKNPVDIQEVKKAIYYARKYHGNQMRESGEPYYSHPIAVAYMVADYLFETDAMVISILHDTIEDTGLTKEMIQNIFGRVIADQVMDLTRIKENASKISSAEILDLLIEQKKYEVALIKVFDRIHNMQTIQAKSPEKIKKIVEETLDHFISLSIYLSTKIPRIWEVEKLIGELCYKALDIKHKHENFISIPKPIFDDIHLQHSFLVPQND